MTLPAITPRAALLMLSGLIAVALVPSMTTVRWWGSLVLALMAVDLVLAPSPAVLEWRRAPSEPLHEGRTTTTTLTVTNPSRRTFRAHIRDAWQPSAGAGEDRHEISLGAGHTATLTTQLTPTRRGDRHADRVTVRSHGPLGLTARQQSYAVPGVQRVVPAFPSRRHLPGFLARVRQLDGRAAIRTRGQGTEFDSLREYISGDDVRSIDWRASARRTGLVVRTWQPERDRHIVVLVDTSRTSAGRVLDTPRLDAALDTALLLAAVASGAGDRVDVLAGDRGVGLQVLARSRTDLMPRLIDALADAEPTLVEADWSELVRAVLTRAPRRALVVLVSPLEPPALSEGLLPLVGTLVARHRVVLASVRDPALDDAAKTTGAEEDAAMAAFAAAAAATTLADRQRFTDVLNRLGVHVIDAEPEALPPAVVEHYLTLKSRGLL